MSVFFSIYRVKHPIVALSNNLEENSTKNGLHAKYFDKNLELNSTNFNSIILWPETKSNRTIEKVPFVIITSKWKDIYTQKEKKKQGD